MNQEAVHTNSAKQNNEITKYDSFKSKNGRQMQYMEITAIDTLKKHEIALQEGAKLIDHIKSLNDIDELNTIKAKAEMVEIAAEHAKVREIIEMYKKVQIETERRIGQILIREEGLRASREQGDVYQEQRRQIIIGKVPEDIFRYILRSGSVITKSKTFNEANRWFQLKKVLEGHSIYDTDRLRKEYLENREAKELDADLTEAEQKMNETNNGDTESNQSLTVETFLGNSTTVTAEQGFHVSDLTEALRVALSSLNEVQQRIKDLKSSMMTNRVKTVEFQTVIDVMNSLTKAVELSNDTVVELNRFAREKELFD